MTTTQSLTHDTMTGEDEVVRSLERIKAKAQETGNAGKAAADAFESGWSNTKGLQDAAAAIERAREKGAVLVCCALGYSRSASAVAAWMLITGRAASTEDAVARVRKVRPRIVLGADALKAIEQAARGKA